VENAQDVGGRLDGLLDHLEEEVAARRMKRRALVLQRRAIPGGWAARFGRAPAAALPVSGAGFDAAVGFVVAVAQAVVVGADGVSVTLRRRGRLMTVAASDEEALKLDHEQNASGAGPSLDATVGRRVHVDSLHMETRWPAFVRTARARGVQTVLSTPLVAANRPIGALTVYSRTAGALAGVEAAWAELVAVKASTMVVAAHRRLT
jgi:hypothetical protein